MTAALRRIDSVMTVARLRRVADVGQSGYNSPSQTLIKEASGAPDQCHQSVPCDTRPLAMVIVTLCHQAHPRF